MTGSVKGWCPSIGRPMAATDGLIMRVKPPGGRLSGPDVIALASAAAVGGNGLVDLTARGNLQFRGFSPETAADFAALTIERGLALAEPGAEARRNILVAPLAGGAALRLVAALTEALSDDARYGALPAKFSFAIEDEAGLPLGPGHGDLHCRLAGGDAWIGFCHRMIAVPVAAALDRLLEIADVFLATPGARRLRDVPAGRLPAGLPAQPPPATPRPGPLAHGDFRGVLAGFPSGQGNIRQWRRLAEGRDWLYPTPWRAVLVPGEAAALAESLRLAVTPDDPRMAIVACTGWPGCASATVPTRSDAARLAAELPRLPGLIHLSGCAKGCAHPGPAAITLTGNAGHYDFIPGGRADGTPLASGLALDEAVDLITSLLENQP